MFFYSLLFIQVRVLTDLGMFSEATRVLMSLLLGEKLPKVSDVGFRTVDHKTVTKSTFVELLFCQFFPTNLNALFLVCRLRRQCSVIKSLSSIREI